MDENQNQPPQNPPPPQVPPMSQGAPIPSANPHIADSVVEERKPHTRFIFLILIGLILIMVIVFVLLMLNGYQSSSKSGQSQQYVPPTVAPQSPTPASSESGISKDDSIDTMEKELDATQVSSQDAEFDQVEQDLNNL